MMRISKEIIDRIRTFKDSDYNSPTLMEEDFYSLTSHIWESISNNDDILNAKDLALFSEVEEFLLEKVIYIHNHEREKGELYRDTLHNAFLLNDIKECFSGDLSYHNIYFLNNDVCDYYFVGDIHSDSFILSVILDKIGLFNEI
ncbi:MAG: hypothetical protein GY756_09075, partial [bacterium]|nr:hypothetical protein [bacterium]